MKLGRFAPQLYGDSIVARCYKDVITIMQVRFAQGQVIHQGIFQRLYPVGDFILDLDRYRLSRNSLPAF